jgi:hypothetical protein
MLNSETQPTATVLECSGDDDTRDQTAGIAKSSIITNEDDKIARKAGDAVSSAERADLKGKMKANIRGHQSREMTRRLSAELSALTAAGKKSLRELLRSRSFMMMSEGGAASRAASGF